MASNATPEFIEKVKKIKKLSIEDRRNELHTVWSKQYADTPNSEQYRVLEWDDEKVSGFVKDKNIERAIQQYANTKFSLNTYKDTKDRKLSTEQIEYFKDTKIVDEKGNLKVYYNGFNNFDVFDSKKN